jgi:hypothetical protein
VIKQRPISILHPYMVEAYVEGDKSAVCLSLSRLKTCCVQNNAVEEGAELEFAGFEVYEEETERCTAPRACWPTPRLGPGGGWGHSSP